ncbi:hypothetical protein [Bosea vaviloviae]|uniref:Uncharacterized protein n=1 Tax=Bosea vaviloviae TaxID=1526658 RepID=A0A0N1N253_9HYPH|nr:hypothetical protein [Bosea vaviloviae]KPH80545.1 hypothetical protein AE618_12285 [Bosea vaviloviae]
MSWLLDQQRQIAASPGIRRALNGPTLDEQADAILAGFESSTGFGLDMDLRHLAGQVRRQRTLPRDTGRDGRFLLHLEHALRDLAVRAPVVPGASS